MQYIELREQLKNFIVFSLPDIKKIDPKFYGSRLNEWQVKGYIKKVRRGYYIFSDLELTEDILYLIANRLYEPSYVSLEIALNHYNLIPEGVYQITSVSTKLPKSFETQLGHFSYRQVKQELFFGYELHKVNGQNYKIAEIEKAVLDYLYLNPVMSDKENFTEWRFDFGEFKQRTDMQKFYRYLANFSSPSLNRRVNRFIKHMEGTNASS